MIFMLVLTVMATAGWVGVFSDVGGRRAPTPRQRVKIDWDIEMAAWLDIERNS